MRLITFSKVENSFRAGALLPGDRVLDLSRAYSQMLEGNRPTDTQQILKAFRAMSASMLEIIRGGDEILTNCFDILKNVENSKFEKAIFSLSDVKLHAPIIDPPAIFHFESDRNFVQKVERDLGAHDTFSQTSWEHDPLYYHGSPMLVSGPDSETAFPEDETEIDFEMELAAVLAEPVRDASLDDAEDAILGYFLVNDWTGRTMQRKLSNIIFGPSKAKALGLVCGPALVTKEELRDPYGLKGEVRVNGEQWAETTTAKMSYTFSEMIAFASDGMTLPAGTIICSGTLPAACGLHTARYLQPGDVVEMRLEKIGSLISSVSERRRASTYQSVQPDAGTN